MSGLSFLGKVPKIDVIYMTRSQEERTVTEVCERVSDQQYLDGVRIKPHCTIHGCDWSSGTKQCSAALALVGNTTG